MPRRFINDTEIANGVENVKAAFAPDIIRIRYNIDEDWIGAPSIFFRVVISDNAVAAKNRDKKLFELSKRIEDRMRTEVEPYELGLQDYFSFRTLSEQAKLKESSWE